MGWTCQFKPPSHCRVAEGGIYCNGYKIANKSLKFDECEDVINVTSDTRIGKFMF